MLFGPQRGSFFTVFDRFAETFGLPIAVVAIALIFGNMQALLENSFILAVTLIAPARRLFSYFFTYYSVDEEKFHVRSGLLNKKNLEIPLDSITSVDFTQNIIFQWADVYGVRVDNASSYGGNGTGKVSLALKRQEAERLKAILLSKSRGGKRSEEKRGEAVRVPVANIIAMGALQTKGSGLAQIISVITVVYGIVSIAFERGLGIEDELTGLIADMPGIWTAFAAAAAFFVISAVLGAFFAVIKYYGFTIRDGGSSVLIEYGLFTKKNHSLMKEKISGVEFVQSMSMRAVKKGYLNVMAVGYGDTENTEKAMMYPLIGEEEWEAFAASYIPAAAFSEKGDRPLKGSIRYFFICPRFIIYFTAAAGALICEKIWKVTEAAPMELSWIWILAAAGALLAVLSVLTEYRNTFMASDGENISLVTGGFTRTKTVIKTKMIESVSDSGSLLKRRKGTVSVKLGIMAPMTDMSKVIRNMPHGAFEKVKKVIHY